MKRSCSFVMILALCIGGIYCGVSSALPPKIQGSVEFKSVAVVKVESEQGRSGPTAFETVTSANQTLDPAQIVADTVKTIRATGRDIESCETTLHLTNMPDRDTVQIEVTGGHPLFVRYYLDTVVSNLIAKRNQAGSGKLLLLKASTPAQPVLSPLDRIVDVGPSSLWWGAVALCAACALVFFFCQQWRRRIIAK